MKKLYFLFTLLLLSLSAHSQGEANIWYFGGNAGLDFNSGNPIALTDGQLDTKEGCATISDSDGNLLFYTDGSTIWNRNHIEMLNGTGLNGHVSSTQSAIIVPKPADSNIYYVFTVDEFSAFTNVGLQYSEIDMQLDGGLGGVTAIKNIQLVAPTHEKVTAVKHSNGIDVWVITHEKDTNNFYTYLVTSSGVNPTPLITSIGTDSHEQGYLKASPDGSKLAIGYSWGGGSGITLELLDFNRTTGEITNVLSFDRSDIFNIYGIEFSQNGDILYVSSSTRISQFDITQPTIIDILSSITVLYNEVSDNDWGALQYAPDNKIYVTRMAEDGFPDLHELSVINNPEVLGVGCDFQIDVIPLGTGIAKLGLPTFNQSYFNVSISHTNVCLGESTAFSLTSTVDSVNWDFGDPSSGVNNTSSNENPTHVFTAPGTYNVTATATSGTDVATSTIEITIHETPIITPIVELKQCDDNVDGKSFFNLHEVIDEITANANNETVTFHELLSDAETGDNPIPNPTTYENEVINNDTVWASVKNANGCISTSQVNLIVSTTQIPVTFATRNFYECDDSADGDTTNGISIFDFSSVDAEIQALFPVGQQLSITYYKNIADALAESNPIPDISNYRNEGHPVTQNIYVRVDSLVDNDCLGLGSHITLHVETVPIANPISIPDECDDDGDGMFAFDTSTYESTIIGSQTNVNVIYTDENGVTLPSPLPNPFLTGTQTITVRVENALSQDTDGACYDETTISFSVDAAAVAHPIADLIQCDDDIDGLYAFDTSAIENTVLNGQTGMLVTYTDSNGNTLPSPLPNPFLTGNETITVRVENPLSTICYDETTFEFIVRERSQFELIEEDVICINESPTLAIETLNPLGNYTYQWSGPNGFSDVGATTTVSEGGVYSVIATSIYGCDSFEKQITISESELATISLADILIVDDSSNNSITISTTNLGFGEYEFALNNEFGDYQDTPIFNNVNAGIHTVYIRDKNDCGTTSIEVSVIGFPNFFTPNGDGVNDYWNVKGINSRFYPTSTIYIYDRFGKIIAMVNPLSDGWDGLYNNKELPETDYWFTVQLIDDEGNIRERKGHFSLIRR